MNHVKTKMDEINKIEGDSKTLKNELEVIDRTLHNLAYSDIKEEYKKLGYMITKKITNCAKFDYTRTRKNMGRI